MNERIYTREDDASDLPYNGDDPVDPLHPDLEDRDRTPNIWDLVESEILDFMEANHSGEIIDRSPSISHELDGDDDSGLIQRHEGHLVGKQEPASATSRSTMDASLDDPRYVPQSYRSAIIGKTIMGSSPTEFTQSASTPSSHSSASTPSIQSSASSCESFISSISALFPPSSGSTKERFSVSGSGLSFEFVKPEASHTDAQSIASTNTELCSSNHLSPVSTTSLDQSHPGAMDDFPHLDIIHELLDEDENTINGSNHPPLLFRCQSINGRHSISSDSANSELNLWGHKPGSLDQTKKLYYDNGFSGIHGGSSNRPRERFQDGHFDSWTAYGLIQSLWHFNPADLSVINLGEADGSKCGSGGGDCLYSYHSTPYYADTGRGLNRYGPYWE